MPLYYASGEAYQFDWSHEIVVISGVTVTVNVAHVRLCHSRMMFARAYMHGSLEMVFDAHDRAFAFFIRSGTRGRFYNVVDLVNRLETETRGSKQGRLADYMTRLDFVILDELGYLPFAQSGVRHSVDSGNVSHGSCGEFRPTLHVVEKDLRGFAER